MPNLLDVRTILEAQEGDDWVADVNLADFTIYGFKTFSQGMAAEIHELVTDASIVRTLDGAPTLTVKVYDPDRRLYKDAFLTYSITMVLDEMAFELAQVKKSGDEFTLVFEDVRVAEMRRRNTPRKVAANTMSRVEFGYLLLSELPAVDFVTPPVPLDVTRAELARGKDNPTVGQKPEDTWEALTRIFNQVKWRFWVDRGKVFAAPDTYLMLLPSAASLQEHMEGVDDIDFDIDTGKPVSTAKVTVISDRWRLPIGARIDIGGIGPESGTWLVSQFERSLFNKQATVTLLRPVVPMPEPPAQPLPGDPNTQPLANVGGTVLDATGQTTGDVEKVVRYALSKEGGPYVWGGTGPVGYDCSGLVQDAFAQVGVQLPRVSYQQYQFCADGGGAIGVDAAATTRGAILERSPDVRGDSGHIAISLGTGNETIEAMGSAYGIRRGAIHGRLFNHGARVPGVAYA